MTGATLTGRLPAELANNVSQALAAAIRRGAAADEACCVAAQVVADYWRSAYGNATLQTLGQVVLQRAEAPLPAGIQSAPLVQPGPPAEAESRIERSSFI